MRRILVADDSKTIQAVVDMTFRATEFEVVTASSGKDALDYLEQNSADIVLLDSTLPGMDGYALCQSIRSNPSTAKVPVLLLTGEVHPYDASRAKAVGANGYLNKPFDTKTILEEVGTLCGTRIAAPAPLSFQDRLAQSKGNGKERPRSAPPPPTASDALRMQSPPPLPSKRAASSAPAASPAAVRASAPAGLPSQPVDVPEGIPTTDELYDSLPAGFVLGAAKDERRAPMPHVSDLAPPPAPTIAAQAPSMPAAAEPTDLLRPRAPANWDDPQEAPRGPTLEPPPPPDETQASARAELDVWELAEPIDDEEEQSGAAAAPSQHPAVSGNDEEVEDTWMRDAPQDWGSGFESARDPALSESRWPEPAPATEKARSAPAPSRPVLFDAAAETIAQRAAEPVARAAENVLSREELVTIAKGVVEAIAWEVVPELAERIIKDEIARLVRDQRSD